MAIIMLQGNNNYYKLLEVFFGYINFEIICKILQLKNTQNLLKKLDNFNK